MKVEVLIQDLLDLAKREGCEQLQYNVYSSSVRSSIQRLFALREEKKMSYYFTWKRRLRSTPQIYSDFSSRLSIHGGFCGGFKG